MHSNTNKLKKNFNEWAIFSIINNVKINEKNVIAWKNIAGKKVTTDLTISMIRKFNGEILLSPTSKESLEILSRLVTSNNVINIFFPTEMVLFQTVVREFSPKGITIVIPSMIVQLDRRKYLRYILIDSENAMIEFKKKKEGLSGEAQKFKKNCYDISAGGISFYVSSIEYPFFKKNDEIAVIKLNLVGKEMRFSAKVVNIFEQNPDNRNGLFYKSWKVCLKMCKIQEESRRIINDFVFEHVEIVDDVI